MGKTLCEVFMAEEQRKLHEPILDHNGKPFSPAQILALERAELTRIRVMRDAMILAERREQLIEMDAVISQASAIVTACRQKLLLIPRVICHRLAGKGHQEICDVMTAEIHKALREMAGFDKEVIRPDWKPGSNGDPFKPARRSSVKRRTSTTAS
jgi:phage terminase Nu1 subunit (DNA packaging protein)